MFKILIDYLETKMKNESLLMYEVAKNQEDHDIIEK